MTVEQILERLPDRKSTSNGWQAKCPAHDDRKASLCIHQEPDGKVLMMCQAGCETKDILAALGLTWDDLFPEKSRSAPSQPGQRKKRNRSFAGDRRVVATYDYVNEDGELLYQVQRTDTKEFIQRRRVIRDNVAKWEYNIKGVTRVLYRLPQIRSAIMEGRPIYLVEGEKDVHTLESWGLTATTNSGGAMSKWLDSFSRSLAGADVIILPDNDAPGKKHAEDVGRSLQATAGRVRVISLPDIKEHSDVTDWAAAGGTLEKLIALQEAVPDFRPGSVHQEYVTPDDIVRIDIKNQPLRLTGQAAINALRAKNKPPYLFLQYGSVVRFRETETGIPLIEQVGDAIMTARLADICDFTSDTNDGVRYHNPPREVVRYVLSSDSLPFPKLVGVTESPLLRPDGTILQKPGYDLDTGYLYKPSEGFEMPEVPLNPTKEQVEDAVDLVKEVFCDFPFVDEASRANTIALMLTPLLKTIIPKIPLAMIDATKWGTGKSLLAEVCATISAGAYSLTTAPLDAEEWRKKITSLLADGKPYIILDNLKRVLESESLAALLTSTTWTDRVLGNSQTTSITNNAVWVVTGNNVQTNGEIARRSYLVQIDAQTSAPHERDVSKFRHPDLMQWVTCNRGPILAALFTIIRAWISASRPLFDTPKMGSFETWVKTIGSILTFVEIAEFLGNRDVLMSDADAESVQWEAFLARWVELYEHYPKTVAQIKDALTSSDGFEGVLPEAISYAIKGDVVNTHKIGKAFKAKEGTRFGRCCYRLQRAGDYKRATLWVVTCDGPTDKDGEFGESGEFLPYPPTREIEPQQDSTHACNGVEQTHQTHNTHQSPGYEEF